MTVHRLRFTTLVAGIGSAALLLAACSSTSTGSSSPSSTPSAAASSAAPTASAAPPASASGSAAAQELGVIDLSTLPVTIPFADVDNHPIVETGFGTAETFPMMLDTGAPVNVSADLVAKFGFPVVGQQQGEAAGGTVTSDVVGVDTVTIGDLTVSTVAAITPWVDKANPLSCLTEYGLVGSNVMKDAVWQIDYQAKTVTVTATTDGIDHVTGAIPVPFRTPGDTPDGSPNIAFGIGNDGLIFLVDTGSDGGIITAPQQLESVGITVPKDAPAVKTLVEGAAGSFPLDIPFVTTTIDLGGMKIDYPVGAADIVQGVGNIGNAFLSQFVVTFDYPNKTIYLDPISVDGTIAPPPITGAAIGWDGTKAIVGGLAVGGPAETAGLKLGDTVTAVDGTPITTRDEFCTSTTGPDPKTITTAAGTFDAGLIDNFFTKQ